MTISGGTFAAATYTDATVAVRDPKTSATRIGGDTITITGGAGPNSPLVVYGDTLAGRQLVQRQPARQSIRDFGTKPFPNIDRQRHAALLLPAGEPVRLRRATT